VWHDLFMHFDKSELGGAVDRDQQFTRHPWADFTTTTPELKFSVHTDICKHRIPVRLTICHSPSLLGRATALALRSRRQKLFQLGIEESDVDRVCPGSAGEVTPD
jgi:hypothetical protein